MAIRLSAILLMIIFAVLQFGGKDLTQSPFAEFPDARPDTVIMSTVEPLDTPMAAAAQPRLAAASATRLPAPSATQAAAAAAIPVAEPAVATALPEGATLPAHEDEAQTALDMAVIDASASVGELSAALTLKPGVSPSSVSGLDAFRERREAAAEAANATGGASLAQVTGSTVNMRAGPSTSDPVVGRAREGERVEWVSEPAPGWALVRHPRYDGDMYMSSAYLDRIAN
ncbi:SH3 domain-containing protein [Poseidonocella sp. HB161398]|uniref:SH3 domain-containing protein n=1 Tax=Poseidonocella sp. HB161398 TaxID=2320855 RepID=UPI001485E671|nr:SH3 domain-containing protein [Poseidonocella sp. HB161398]